MPRLLPILLSCALLLPGAIPAAAAAEAGCDRDCLRELMDDYLNAVVAHNPGDAALIPGFRQTENAVVKRLGTGVWESTTAIRADGRYYFDPLTAQAVWFGIMDEGTVPTVAMVRIRQVDGAISEAEWYISRPGADSMQGPADMPGGRANLYDPEGWLRDPPPARTVPAAERLSRASLIGISNSYFDGLTAADGSLVLAHPACKRLENGVLVTGRSLAEGRTDGYEGKTNCGSNFSNFNMALVGDRRFFVIDEEQQVAVSSAIFLRNANGPERRCVFFELFYIDAGLISQIYSVIYYPDPNLPAPNWEPYQGNFPLPESFGAAR